MYRATISPLTRDPGQNARIHSAHESASGIVHDVTRIDDELLKQAWVEEKWRKAALVTTRGTLDEYLSAKKRTFALMMEHVAHEYGYELKRRSYEASSVASPVPENANTDAPDTTVVVAAASDNACERATTKVVGEAASEAAEVSDEAAEEQPTPPDSEQEDDDAADGHAASMSAEEGQTDSTSDEKSTGAAEDAADEQADAAHEDASGSSDTVESEDDE